MVNPGEWWTVFSATVHDCMARLAFLTSLAPTLRADTGFEIANRCIIDSLRAQGHSVRVFAFARPDDELRPDPI